MTKVAEVSDYGVHRMHDEEAGVVCWVYKDAKGYGGMGGISCVPVEDTGLRA